jgi:3-hydroxyisobutyrate dehydrogenase-like beta-hydroxyacid dehydrogenase
MAEITFLGLGLMGTALAETMVKAGHDTVVWNRTPSRADSLVAMGARLVPDPADAITKCPITVVCVSDYDASDSFLRTPESLAALNGRVLVQLTSGSYRLARESNEWVTQAGASYLDGGIMGYPSDIGTSDSTFIMAGDEKAYTQAEPLLRILAPNLEYLGDDPGRASAMDSAVMAADFGLIMGVFTGAAICEATGISIKQYVELARPILAMDLEAQYESAIKYEDNGTEKTDAYLKQWREVIDPVVETTENAGYNAEFPTLVRTMLDRAIDQGWGTHDVGALIKILRPDSK